MPAYTDLSKAHEVANLARRLQKDLRDAVNDAAKYNNRERLFDMPVSNVRTAAFAASGTHVLKKMWEPLICEPPRANRCASK